MIRPSSCLLPLAILLPGCVGTISHVVTAPVKLVAKSADWATTSRDEADRNRGRAERRAEDRARKRCRHEFRDDQQRERCVRDRLGTRELP